MNIIIGYMTGKHIVWLKYISAMNHNLELVIPREGWAAVRPQKFYSVLCNESSITCDLWLWYIVKLYGAFLFMCFLYYFSARLRVN